MPENYFFLAQRGVSKKDNSACGRIEEVGPSPLRHAREIVMVGVGQRPTSEWAAARGRPVTFNELMRLLEADGFQLVRPKGAIRHYGKPAWPRVIRVDYHGARQVPTGTCHAILKAAGIPKP